MVIRGSWHLSCLWRPCRQSSHRHVTMLRGAPAGSARPLNVCGGRFACAGGCAFAAWIKNGDLNIKFLSNIKSTHRCSRPTCLYASSQHLGKPFPDDIGKNPLTGVFYCLPKGTSHARNHLVATRSTSRRDYRSLSIPRNLIAYMAKGVSSN